MGRTVTECASALLRIRNVTLSPATAPAARATTGPTATSVSIFGGCWHSDRELSLAGASAAALGSSVSVQP